MDDFIHGILGSFLKRDPRYCLSVVSEDGLGMAKDRKCYFLTVDAYHSKSYSAIPFYEKQGFFALQDYSDDFDTLRMAKRV